MTESAPETLPAEWYRDASRWPVERARIFAASWQVLTHEIGHAIVGFSVALRLAPAL